MGNQTEIAASGAAVMAGIGWFSDNAGLASQLNKAGQLVHQKGQEMARAGQALFKAGTFTDQMASVRGLVSSSAQLKLQYDSLSSLAPKLGALAAPFTAIGQAMSGLKLAFDPGKPLRDAQSAASKAQSEMSGKEIELKAKIGWTAATAKTQLAPFLSELEKAKTYATQKRVSNLPMRGVVVAEELIAANRELQKAQAVMARGFITPAAGKSAAADLALAEANVQKAQAAVAKLGAEMKAAEAATKAVEMAVAKLAAESQKMRGKIGAGKITEADARQQLKPYEAAVAAAKERVSIVGKTSKADIGMGGAVSALVNFGSAFLRVGAIAFTAGKAIFSVFSWVGGVLWSVAKGIFSAFQWAFEKIVAGAKWAFKMIAGAAAVTGTAIGYSMKQAANIETQRAAMGLLLKDVALGNKIIADIQNRTMQTPFSFDVLAQQARYMTAVGIAGKDIPKFLDAIADAAAGTGKGVIALQEISLALGQIQSKGRLQAEEMTRQLANAGVNAWKYLADASGKSVREIQEQMRKDVIEAKDALPLIIAGMQRQFGGAAARLAQSTEGVWARIAAGAKLIAVELGEPINRVITPWLNRLLSNFEMAKRYASDIGKRLADGLNVFANAWQAGTLVQTLWTQLKWVFAEAGNWLLAAFKAVGNSLVGIFRIEGLFTAIGEVIAGAFKFGIGLMLPTLVVLSSEVLEALRKPVILIADLLEYGLLRVAGKFGHMMLSNIFPVVKIYDKIFGTNNAGYIADLIMGLVAEPNQTFKEFHEGGTGAGKLVGQGFDYATGKVTSLDGSVANRLVEEGKAQVTRSSGTVGALLEQAGNVVGASFGAAFTREKNATDIDADKLRVAAAKKEEAAAQKKVDEASKRTSQVGESVLNIPVPEDLLNNLEIATAKRKKAEGEAAKKTTFGPEDKFDAQAKKNLATAQAEANALRDKFDFEKKADFARLDAAEKNLKTVTATEDSLNNQATVNLAKTKLLMDQARTKGDDAAVERLQKKYQEQSKVTEANVGQADKMFRAQKEFNEAKAEWDKDKTTRAMPEPKVPPALKDVTAKARTEVKTDFAGAAGTFSAAALSSLGAYGGAADKVVGAIGAGNILLGDIKTNTANMGSTWQ